MIELIRPLASMMPIEKHVKQLKKRCENYESAVSDSEKEKAEVKVLVASMMFTYAYFDKDKDLPEIMKNNQELKQASDFLSTLRGEKGGN